MAVDVSPWFQDCADLAERSVSERARGLEGSQILKIAGEVDALIKKGAKVANFTVGDFSPRVFQIPDVLKQQIQAALHANKTNYPPAVGVPELREAIRALYERDLALSYPLASIQVGSGARPPIYGMFLTVVDPGDIVVYPVPSWNNNYYCYLTKARGVAVPTKPQNGFQPTIEDLAPHLRTARLLCLNSPNNPTGTVFSADRLRAICDAVLDENKRRRAVGDRPLLVFYDQVYWQLTFGDAKHHTPVGLVPEMARYTLFVDAISKSHAATGLRVGWGVFPPWILAKTQPLIAHMGAWAGRPEQHATAALLSDPSLTTEWMAGFKSAVSRKLTRLADGIQALKAAGKPVDSLAPEGAIYLSVKLDLLGRTLKDGRKMTSDDDIRRLLLEDAGIAVVPFTAFGLPYDTGWARLSVGAVDDAEVEGAIDRLGSLLDRVL